MVATLGAAQRKEGLTTLDVTLSTSLALDHVKCRNAIKPSRHVAESNPRCRGKEGH